MSQRAWERIWNLVASRMKEMGKCVPNTTKHDGLMLQKSRTLEEVCTG